MPPTLEQVFTMHLGRSKSGPDTLDFGTTKGGARRFISPIPYGFLRSTSDPNTASPISAEITPGGADWLTVDPATHTTHLNVRCHLRDPASGGLYYVRFEGLIVLDEKIKRVLEWSPNATSTESKDHYGFSYPIFEVSREEDKWMERTAFVAHQRFCHPGDGTSAVEFEVYRLVTG